MNLSKMNWRSEYANLRRKSYVIASYCEDLQRKSGEFWRQGT